MKPRWVIELFKGAISTSSFICAYQPVDTDDKDKLLTGIEKKGFTVEYKYTRFSPARATITQHYVIRRR